SSNGAISLSDRITLVNNMYLVIFAVILCFPLLSGIKYISEKLAVSSTVSSAAATFISAVLLLLTSAMLVEQTTHPFLYFRF
ncbi:MAG: MBOAT family protein, partial [Ruminococcus sp.]|nr:MBOAT family protein [Ruminococcus sp.]